MKQYLDLIQNIIDNGVKKESGRANMPSTLSISGTMIKLNMADGFPLLTTKKMFLKGIIHELLWILRGDTNIKYLVDNNVNIWNDDAYRWYLKKFNEIEQFKNIEPFTKDEFIEKVKEGNYSFKGYVGGDLGKVYGYQWRNSSGVDQLRRVIEGLQNNPYSRYHIIDAWSPHDFLEMALPPCHLLYQFTVRPLSFEERKNLTSKNVSNVFSIFSHADLDALNIPKFYLDLVMYQRSADACCGIPFNLASMSLLLMIISNTVNMVPGITTWLCGDTHIYMPHIKEAKNQIQRKCYKLPQLQLNKKLNSLEDIEKLSIDDFILSEYNFHPSIKYELFVGLKKGTI